MSGITTHILDTTLGRPAVDMRVELERLQTDWVAVGSDRTDEDGRAKALLAGQPDVGTYRLRFHVGEYFARAERAAFYPYVEIVFEAR